MPLVEWKPEYGVGSPEVDAQHRKLVDLINQLHGAMQAGARPAALQQIMNELVGYTRYHFDFEEKVMERAGYPDLSGHQRIHRAMVAQVEKMREEAQSSRVGFSIKLMGFLKTWLTDHILGTDRKYAPYLEKVKA